MGTRRGFLGGSVVNNLPANAGDVRDMGLIPEYGRYMATHPHILAQIISWTEESGRLQSIGSQHSRTQLKET